MTVTGGQLGQKLVMKGGPAEPVPEAVPGKERETLPDGTTFFRFGAPVDRGPRRDPEPVPVELRRARVELVPFVDLAGREEDGRKPVPVDPGRDVEFVNLPGLEEDERMPELKLLGLDMDILEVAGRVELVELLLRREVDPPVGAVTPVSMPERDGVCADTSLAIAKATRTISKANFMIARY